MHHRDVKEAHQQAQNETMTGTMREGEGEGEGEAGVTSRGVGPKVGALRVTMIETNW